MYDTERYEIYIIHTKFHCYQWNNRHTLIYVVYSQKNWFHAFTFLAHFLRLTTRFNPMIREYSPDSISILFSEHSNHRILVCGCVCVTSLRVMLLQARWYFNNSFLRVFLFVLICFFLPSSVNMNEWRFFAICGKA